MFHDDSMSGRKRYSLDDLGRDDLAGTTPDGETIQDHQRVLLKCLIELRLRLEVVNAFFAHCC